MTKSELIAKLAARFPQLVAKDAELAVKMILDTLAGGKRLGHGIEDHFHRELGVLGHQLGETRRQLRNQFRFGHDAPCLL